MRLRAMSMEFFEIVLLDSLLGAFCLKYGRRFQHNYMNASSVLSRSSMLCTGILFQIN